MSLNYFTKYSSSLDIKKESYDAWVEAVNQVVNGEEVTIETGMIFQAVGGYVESNPDLVVVGEGYLKHDEFGYAVSSTFELLDRHTKALHARLTFWDEVPEYVKLELYEGADNNGEDEYSLVVVHVTDDVPLDLDDSFYKF